MLVEHNATHGRNWRDTNINPSQASITCSSATQNHFYSFSPHIRPFRAFPEQLFSSTQKFLQHLHVVCT
jgi:hypothetical protein